MFLISVDTLFLCLLNYRTTTDISNSQTIFDHCFWYLLLVLALWRINRFMTPLIPLWDLYKIQNASIDHSQIGRSIILLMFRLSKHSKTAFKWSDS